MHQKVGVKVGGDCLQIASVSAGAARLMQWRQMDLSASIKSYIVDVIAFRDIDDLVPDGDRLTIKHNSTESVTLIARPDAPYTLAEGSFEAARSARLEFEAVIRSRVRETPVVLAERALRPSDVPGTLLNMGLLNLCAPDETLRLAAYGLIGDVAEAFHYDVAKVLKVSGESWLWKSGADQSVSCSRITRSRLRSTFRASSQPPRRA
jgi:neurofibromin 1